jgi:hypothetical protein
MMVDAGTKRLPLAVGDRSSGGMTLTLYTITPNRKVQLISKAGDVSVR